eukprot:7461703-Pyramimonas_sp.AAC.1
MGALFAELDSRAVPSGDFCLCGLGKVKGAAPAVHSSAKDGIERIQAVSNPRENPPHQEMQ